MPEPSHDPPSTLLDPGAACLDYYAFDPVFLKIAEGDDYKLERDLAEALGDYAFVYNRAMLVNPAYPYSHVCKRLPNDSRKARGSQHFTDVTKDFWLDKTSEADDVPNSAASAIASYSLETLQTQDKFGKTPAYYAIVHGDTKALRQMLEAGMDPDIRQRGDKTLLHHAVLERRAEAVRILVSAGADVNAQDSYGHITPLGSAVVADDIAILDYLIENGADINAPNTNFRSRAIMIAVRAGRLEIVKRLVEQGAAIDLPWDDLSRYGRGHSSLLEQAIMQRKPEVLSYLLTLKSPEKYSAPNLRAASVYGLGDVVKLLLGSGVAPDGIFGEGIRAQFYSYQKNANAVVHEPGALVGALNNKNFNIVEVLIGAGVTVQQAVRPGSMLWAGELRWMLGYKKARFFPPEFVDVLNFAGGVHGDYGLSKTYLECRDVLQTMSHSDLETWKALLSQMEDARKRLPYKKLRGREDVRDAWDFCRVLRNEQDRKIGAAASGDWEAYKALVSKATDINDLYIAERLFYSVSCS